jgi:hypothetical protein
MLGASGGAPAGVSRSADVYLNTPTYSAAQSVQTPQDSYPQMTTMYRCPPSGCYAPNAYSSYNGYGYPPSSYMPYYYPLTYVYTAPIVVRRGSEHEPFRRPEHPRAPAPRAPGPVGRRP